MQKQPQLEEGRLIPFSPEHLASLVDGYQNSNIASQDILAVAQHDASQLAEFLLSQGENCESQEGKEKLAFVIEKVTKLYIAIEFAREHTDELQLRIDELEAQQDA